MKEDDIQILIERYFDAELSLSEEKELLNMLLSREGKDPATDEALAVMLLAKSSGVSHVGGLDSGKKRRSHGVLARNIRIRSVAVVAALAVIVSVAALVGAFSVRQGGYDGMVAYVGGVRVNDRSEIIKIVDNQLSDMGMCSDFMMQEVSADLGDIRQALNSDGL